MSRLPAWLGRSGCLRGSDGRGGRDVHRFYDVRFVHRSVRIGSAGLVQRNPEGSRFGDTAPTGCRF